MWISVETLRDRVSSATAGESAEQARLDGIRRFEKMLRNEEDSAGMFFNVARLSLLIDRFPERIPGLAVVRKDLIWRTEESPLYVHPRGQKAVVRCILETLSIGDVPGAIDAVVGILGWDMETLTDDLIKAAERLPRHVVSAFFRLDVEEMARVFDREPKDLPFDQVAVAACHLRVDFRADEFAPQGYLARFACRSGLPYLKALVALRMLGLDGSVLVAGASKYDLEVVDAVVEMGVPINAVGGARSESALHVAARGVFEPHSSEEAIAFAHGLVKRGIDVGLSDRDGRTAIDLLADGIDSAYGSGKSWRLDMMLVEELLTVLKISREVATT